MRDRPEHLVDSNAEIRRGPRRNSAGGRSRRRMFDAGELRLVLLILMEAQPRHGYDLIREIETRAGGLYAPSPGIVYPTLAMLEELGHIETLPSVGGAKRPFTLTAAGQAYIAEYRLLAEAALLRLDILRIEGGQIEAGPVWRAMQNLKASLELRLAGPQAKETLFAAADLIDDAARKIERLP